MTRIIYHTCINCYDNYSYQSSGEGCGRPENDGDYCPRCKLNIIEALGRVPKVAEWTQVDVEGEEKERVLTEKKRKDENPDKLWGNLTIRECSSDMFRFVDGQTKVATRYHPARLDGVKYSVIEDFLDGKPVRVTKNVLRNFKTGKTYVPYQKD